jgi:hypothetical protein
MLSELSKSKPPCLKLIFLETSAKEECDRIIRKINSEIPELKCLICEGRLGECFHKQSRGFNIFGFGTFNFSIISTDLSFYDSFHFSFFDDFLEYLYYSSSDLIKIAVDKFLRTLRKKRVSFRILVATILREHRKIRAKIKAIFDPVKIIPDSLRPINIHS